MKAFVLFAMRDHHRLLLLILIMTFVVITAGSIGIYFLYQAAFKQQQMHLSGFAKSYSGLLASSVDSGFDSTQNNKIGTQTLNLLESMDKRRFGFGESSELLVARKSGDEIIFLENSRQSVKPENGSMVSQSPALAQMKQALNGESGVGLSKDFDGVTILGAYEPVQYFGWGVVVQIALYEIQRPFMNAILLAAAVAMIAILTGTIMFFRVTDPIITNAAANLARIRAIVETAIDAVITIDDKGVICTANSSVERLFGYSINEVVGQNVKMLMAEAHRNQHDHYIRKYLSSGVKKIIGIGREVEGTHKDGYQFPIRISVSEFFMGNDRMFVGIMHDLREHKALEQRIIQSERLAVIGKMAAKVAHEVRNPLSSISLNAELLEEEIEEGLVNGTEEARGLLTSMISEIDRVAALTEEYLQFSRLPQSIPVEGNLVEVITEVLQLSKAEFEQSGIDYELICLDKKQVSAFDRAQLRRVLLNLIRNACESMPGGGKLTVSCERSADFVVVSVSDTGIGIPAAMVKNVFNPFFTTKDFGTGLGLAIAQQVVSEHHGYISCVSSEGEGSIFKIKLPYLRT